ncbi:hypothetical protein C8Q76DRAFT_786591 [Earliella scabrosa]|nr:hypothetical protein C8Q76DRAFT_786591 [Earliella scabrosa]
MACHEPPGPRTTTPDRFRSILDGLQSDQGWPKVAFIRTRAVRQCAEQAHTQAPDGTANSLRTRKHPWTRTHSFYAIMGGFVLQDPHESPAEPYLPSWQRNGVLTPDGVRLIMEHRPHLIPDIPRSELLDRSKADDLGKAVLVWQVLWFCLSCLNRAIQGLPLCLLEVTTIAHAFCALLTYAFWWSKPKNIHHPIPLAGDAHLVREIGAWMSIRSGAQRPIIGGLITFSLSPEIVFIDALKLEKHLHTPEDRAELLRTTEDFSSQGHQALGHGSTSSLRLLPPLYKPTRKVLFVFSTSPLPWYIWGSRSTADEEERMLRRLDLSNSLPDDAFGEHPSHPSDSDGPTYITPAPHLQVSAAGAGFFVTSVAAIILTAAYGLPHLIGWTVKFTTLTERRLWQAATILVMAIGILLIAILGVKWVVEQHFVESGRRRWAWLQQQFPAITHRRGVRSAMARAQRPPQKAQAQEQPPQKEQVEERPQEEQSVAPEGSLRAATRSWYMLRTVTLWHRRWQHEHQKKKRASENATHAILFIITIVYSVSSAYLIVESLRQLVALPPEAFVLPSWGNYWPHFS